MTGNGIVVLWILLLSYDKRFLYFKQNDFKLGTWSPRIKISSSTSLEGSFWHGITSGELNLNRSQKASVQISDVAFKGRNLPCPSLISGVSHITHCPQKIK